MRYLALFLLLGVLILSYFGQRATNKIMARTHKKQSLVPPDRRELSEAAQHDHRNAVKGARLWEHALLDDDIRPFLPAELQEDAKKLITDVFGDEETQ